MPLESQLTRDLDIRFIDARRLVAEARVNLNLSGYIGPEQESLVLQEARRVFAGQTSKTRKNLQRSNWEMEQVKLMNGSMSLSDWHDSAATIQAPDFEASFRSDASCKSTKSILKYN